MSKPFITVAEYFGRYADHKDVTEAVRAEAEALLDRVNRLIEFLATKKMVRFQINPLTKSLISGAGAGGFRPQGSSVGAPSSSHKEGRGVDIYDPDGDIDDAIDDAILEQFGLFREHPAATRSWCHITTRSPRSGKRSFYP
jgi:hypothetical protein